MCPLYRRYTDLSYWRRKKYVSKSDGISELFNAVPLYNAAREIGNGDNDLYIVYGVSKNSSNASNNFVNSSTSTIITIDSDDEYETPLTQNETSSCKRKSDDSIFAAGPSKCLKKTKRKPKKKSGFILDEASDVDDCLSDDCENTQQELNADDSIVEFIDDDSEDELTTQSVYLKSIKNVGLPPTRKFKLQYDFDPDIDVYSQAVVQDEEYEMDSFCCDEIVYDDDDDNDDDLMSLQISSPNLKSRSIHNSSTPVANKSGQNKRRYKRVTIESP